MPQKRGPLSESKAPTRSESDSLGTIDVEHHRYWGAQTERSRRNFRIGEESMPRPLIRALALVKKAAALTNRDIGLLEERLATAIAAAADEVIEGRFDAHFPLVVWQTGSGTQTNMNMNEVIANRASELLGGPRGEARLVHPNDHVNRSQSSNDVFPTAMAMAALRAIDEGVTPSVTALRDALAEKSREFADVVKLGRTHLMDATPVTLGQEIGGWAQQLTHCLAHLGSAR